MAALETHWFGLFQLSKPGVLERGKQTIRYINLISTRALVSCSLLLVDICPPSLWRPPRSFLIAGRTALLPVLRWLSQDMLFFRFAPNSLQTGLSVICLSWFLISMSSLTVSSGGIPLKFCSLLVAHKLRQRRLPFVNLQSINV